MDSNVNLHKSSADVCYYPKRLSESSFCLSFGEVELLSQKLSSDTTVPLSVRQGIEIMMNSVNLANGKASQIIGSDKQHRLIEHMLAFPLCRSHGVYHCHYCGINYDGSMMNFTDWENESGGGVSISCPEGHPFVTVGLWRV